MKTKSFILLLFCSSSYSAFSQVEKEENNKWGCAVSINSCEAQIGDPEYASWGYVPANFRNFGDKSNKSISMSIIPRYFIRENILLRFEIGITNINLSSYYSSKTSSSNSDYLTMNQTIKQKIYRYIPGIQWNFMKKKIFESYCGISAIYINYKDMNYTNHTEYRDLPSDTLTGLIADRATATGGFAAGLGAVLGFNIYLQKHISIGIEFSDALLYYKIGGPFGGEATFQNVPNSSTTEVYSYSTSSYKGVQFSKILSSFNVSIWFGAKNKNKTVAPD